MEVTSQNFYKIFPRIIKDVNTCDFCAIDCEFSGIIPFENLYLHDTAETRYERMREYDKDYVILQIGLSFFTRRGQNRYYVSSYTIYLTNTDDSKYINFMCSNKAIKFLSNTDFDFNKTFSDGVGYVSMQNRDASKEPGFSEVIWELSMSNKLVIGHNMLADVMHIVKHFFSPLPNSYPDFQKQVHRLFPKIIDVKYMASLSPLNNFIKLTALDRMHNRLEREPFKSLEIENNLYFTQGKFHDAGFDAYITGLCFIRMQIYLEEMSLKRYMNKIFLMKSNNEMVCELESNCITDEPDLDSNKSIYTRENSEE